MIQIIVLFGLVSLFGDAIYEGARSISGPFLGTLGASAAAVGLFTGLAEFCSYGVRLISGYLADRGRSYWTFIFIGYGLLVSMPLMSVANTWHMAIAFIIIERIGKALRGPARDTVVSMASAKIGTGLGFGITEVLDQVGAVAGPLMLAGALILAGGGPQKSVGAYHGAYMLLWIPFILLIVCLAVTYRRIPDPVSLEPSDETEPQSFSRLFWLYTAFTFVAAAGFVNAILLGYHFKTSSIFADAIIPMMYAMAMATDAVAALIIGKAYDILKRRGGSKTGGLNILIVIPLLTMVMMPCAFSQKPELAAVGMVLWGVIMGAHETVMRSGIADLTHVRKRGAGYGIFNTAYGLALFAGSALMGLLYSISLNILVSAAIGIECAAVVLFFMMRKEVLRGEDRK